MLYLGSIPRIGLVFNVGGVENFRLRLKEKRLGFRLDKNSTLPSVRLFNLFVSTRAWILVIAFALMGLFAAGAGSQDATSLLSFDAKAIEQWIEQKRKNDPAGFDQPKCLRSDAFSSNSSASCLAQQAVFFLTEVNKRRMIEQEALRKTLQLTDDKRFEAAQRAEIAETTLAKAEAEMAKLEILTDKLAALETKMIQNDQVSLELKNTNAALLEAYKSLTDKLHQGLLDSLDNQ